MVGSGEAGEGGRPRGGGGVQCPPHPGYDFVSPSSPPGRGGSGSPGRAWTRGNWDNAGTPAHHEGPALPAPHLRTRLQRLLRRLRRPPGLALVTWPRSRGVRAAPLADSGGRPPGSTLASPGPPSPPANVGLERAKPKWAVGNTLAGSGPDFAQEERLGGARSLASRSLLAPCPPPP